MKSIALQTRHRSQRSINKSLVRLIDNREYGSIPPG